MKYSYFTFYTGNSNILLLLILLFCCHSVCAQEQEVADSLEFIYHSKSHSDIQKLELLKGISENEYEISKRLKYSEALIKLAEKLDSTSYIFSGYLQKGNAYRLSGDLSNALESLLKAEEIANDKQTSREVGIANIAIADVYSVMGNHNRAIQHYNNAINLLKQSTDSSSYASALLNKGDEYFLYGELDSAMVNFQKSGEIFENIQYENGVAYNLGNMGLVYAQKGEIDKAEENIYKSVRILQEIGDFSPICVYLTYISDIYLEKGQDSLALNFASQSLDIARTYGLKEEISQANLKLSELYEHKGDINKSFGYYKDYVVFRDSVRNITAVQEMANLKADQQQAEVNLLKEKEKNQKLVVISVSSASVLIALLAFGLYRRNRFIKRTSLIIEKEKNRSDSLLLNILPEETARELKEYGHVEAKKFESVSVLFADFKDFTRYAEKLAPEKLIKTIDYYFSRFDKVMEKYGIEKIKTLGDSYMAASGLPFISQNHASRMLLAAFEIAEIVEKTKLNNDMPEASFDVRIGIHSGPIVAGVVGTKKFAYDIWGDTVNIASRMETSSAAGRINISESTYELVKNEFDCDYRGEIEVRNRGILKMYYVNGLKEELRNTESA